MKKIKEKAPKKEKSKPIDSSLKKKRSSKKCVSKCSPKQEKSHIEAVNVVFQDKRIESVCITIHLKNGESKTTILQSVE